jgi:hypothetical protein
MSRFETPAERKARQQEQAYEKATGRRPRPRVDDWQFDYQGTPEEKARLRVWMGYEDDEEPERGPQPDQNESLF